ncbi:hypothetical protein Ade02nite_28370 [Paractinoplanes deccanensis]|uniref:Uncharacterized protein n=1 Tax=Paractinoplanes deccanensis TaxID=113561 RepID=A0ABQ3Y2I8_9ACTN|nr:hypothetical protein [Actinoplanes deccanensis]GID74196.1 hypothetical protein Ade02nite_28370 [Actinoplanes deccanensis]
MSMRDRADFVRQTHTPMSTGGLDDLFGYREEPVPVEELTPVEKRRSARSWFLVNVAVIAVVTVVVVALLRSSDIDISVVFVVTALIALRLVVLAVQWVKAPPVPKRSASRGMSGRSGTDSLRAAVRRWEKTLQRAHDDPDQYWRNVLPVLAELTDERLRLRHGITRQSDPRRARELLGDPLWAALQGGEKKSKPRDLATYVDALERL